MINNETARQVLPTVLELALDADIDIQFDDFEDLRENPMLQPLMASFPDLFESISRQSLASIFDFKKEFNPEDPLLAIEEDTPDYIKKDIKSALLMFKIV